MAPEITLRLIVEQPPPGVDYGLQKGSGKLYETVQKQRSDGRDLVFEFQALIGQGSLRGPFVQGPPGGRFIYIGIGSYSGQADAQWSGRLKVPLADIPPDIVASGGRLEARVPGAGRNGAPAFATVKDFAGWTPAP